MMTRPMPIVAFAPFAAVVSAPARPSSVVSEPSACLRMMWTPFASMPVGGSDERDRLQREDRARHRRREGDRPARSRKGDAACARWDRDRIGRHRGGHGRRRRSNDRFGLEPRRHTRDEGLRHRRTFVLRLREEDARAGVRRDDALVGLDRRVLLVADAKPDRRAALPRRVARTARGRELRIEIASNIDFAFATAAGSAPAGVAPVLVASSSSPALVPPCEPPAPTARVR